MLTTLYQERKEINNKETEEDFNREETLVITESQTVDFREK
jgi:hypothetical protein